MPATVALRDSRLDCGSGDQDSIPGIPLPCVGPLMARRLRTSSDDPVPMFGWLGTLKTPSCLWRWVPGSRSKFENWTTVPSLYSWNIAECNVKPQPTNHRVTCACKILACQSFNYQLVTRAAHKFSTCAHQLFNLRVQYCNLCSQVTDANCAIIIMHALRLY